MKVMKTFTNQMNWFDQKNRLNQKNQFKSKNPDLNQKNLIF